MDWPGLRDVDFHPGLRHGRRSLGLAVVAGGGLGLAMALADASLFRAVVPAVQHVLLQALPFGSRLVLAWLGALSDELVLRLAGLTVLVWLGTVLAGGERPWVHPLAIGLTAGVLWSLLALPYLRDLYWTPLGAVREIVLHGAAGLLWGWLCWRHGWLAGLAGHCSASLVLQALLPLSA